MVARISARSRSGVSPGETLDEAAVELQFADCEAAQVGEGGEAGAEVIDGDAHAEVAQVAR